MKWEYLHTRTERDGIEEILNIHGRQGWELVAVAGSGPMLDLIFKRPLAEKAN
jgi:uncharacterized protein involved in propanediol utilization